MRLWDADGLENLKGRSRWAGVEETDLGLSSLNEEEKFLRAGVEEAIIRESYQTRKKEKE